LQYRIYLLNLEGRIAAAESFYSTGDDEAAAMAFDIYSLSSDVIVGYELWRGAMRLVEAKDRPRPVPPDFDGMIISRQARTLELEERLQSTFACIRESRQLMEAVSALLEKRY
jgi:hypothetical protein